MDRLRDKVAIVTGAARGQGLAEAELFVSEGAQVIVAELLEEQGHDAARSLGPNARFESLDVSSKDQWVAVVGSALDTFGRIDVLINNAAISMPERLPAIRRETTQRIFEVNQLGCLFGMQTVIPHMIEQ